MAANLKSPGATTNVAHKSISLEFPDTPVARIIDSASTKPGNPAGSLKGPHVEPALVGDHEQSQDNEQQPPKSVVHRDGRALIRILQNVRVGNVPADQQKNRQRSDASAARPAVATCSSRRDSADARAASSPSSPSAPSPLTPPPVSTLAPSRRPPSLLPTLARAPPTTSAAAPPSSAATLTAAGRAAFDAAGS
ncbi:hypothetical protein DFJ73DRAFT_781993 [Zopfochytrium polystomum]|nr:hypothetical protein DFJ73DRAFT_781993 [Zopfochytrium polystomum]